MVRGATREEIAADLNLSEETVKTHERNLRRKTGHQTSQRQKTTIASAA